MKIYGFDDTGPARGELRAAQVDARQVDFGIDRLAAAIGWDHADTSFSRARRMLLQAMEEHGADPGQLRLVRSMKSYDIPVDDIR